MKLFFTAFCLVLACADAALLANTGWRDPAGRSGRKKSYIRRVGDVVLDAGI